MDFRASARLRGVDSILLKIVQSTRDNIYGGSLVASDKYCRENKYQFTGIGIRE